MSSFLEFHQIYHWNQNISCKKCICKQSSQRIHMFQKGSIIFFIYFCSSVISSCFITEYNISMIYIYSQNTLISGVYTYTKVVLKYKIICITYYKHKANIRYFRISLMLHKPNISWNCLFGYTLIAPLVIHFNFMK